MVLQPMGQVGRLPANTLTTQWRGRRRQSQPVRSSGEPGLRGRMDRHPLRRKPVGCEALAPFELRKHLSANRTQGVPNMIALVKETAERLAA